MAYWNRGHAVLSGHSFRRIKSHRPGRSANRKRTNVALRRLISEHIIERFARISGTHSLVIPLVLPIPEEFEQPAASPCHPACTEHEGSDYCRESLQLHLAELRRRPETHWHKCDFGRFCAYIPVAYNARCLAAVKLACPASMAEKDFNRQMELLDVLVRDFVTSEADSQNQVLKADATDAGLDAVAVTAGRTGTGASPTHPKIVRVLRYIEEHLQEPNLTVGRIAEELDIYPTYLSQLFVDQAGQRMSRFIAARRIEQAKNLLATTDWQIKRIARETGHANPRWFCYVFREFVGLTPGGYRRRSRGQARIMKPRTMP